MYKLTLTFESGQMMADVIADLVNNHREMHLAVHLDEMISSDHPEYVPTAADRFSGETIREAMIHQPQRKPAVKASAPRKPARLVKSDQKAKAAFRAHKRDLQLAAAREMDIQAGNPDKWWVKEARLEWAKDATRLLGCPRCFVGKGDLCVRVDGKSEPGWAHAERVQAHHRGLTVEQMQHQMGIKAAQKDNVYRINGTVDCPTCGVAMGERCVTEGGHKMGHYSHKARVIAAQGVL